MLVFRINLSQWTMIGKRLFKVLFDFDFKGLLVLT